MENRKEDFMTMAKIAERAEQKGLIPFDRLSMIMDLELATEAFNLRLNELLQADDFNFAHDIIGITNNINRQTKTFENCFLPRYASK